MSDLKPYTGPTKLVVAFDIGTTYSGISYCILEPGRVPEILGVTRFPEQTSIHSDAKVPSLLYYDKNGNVRARGAEVLVEWVVETALREDWTKAEWWKLHLCPKHLASSINPGYDFPPLPPGKSIVEVLSDYIRFLFECLKTYLVEHHPSFAWSPVEDTIEYIFTHPNNWEDAQPLYRRAIEHAGLVPSTPKGRSRVHMLTEGEAGLHFCVPNLLNAESINQYALRGVVIIDAGGRTINLSMFSMTCNPISCEEIAPAECRLQGSVFVTRRAKAWLQRKLEGWEHSSPEEIDDFMREFDRTTKLLIKSDKEPAYIKVTGRRYNNSTYNILSGRLKLSGEEATSLFNDSIHAIIDAFEQQQKSVPILITTAFLVGGLSTNDWLWSRLQLHFAAKNIKICRPDNRFKKAVADGAVLSHVDRDHHLATCDNLQKMTRLAQESSSAFIVAHLEKTVAELRAELVDKANENDGLNKTIAFLRATLRAYEQKHQCEALYDQCRIHDAASSLSKIMNTIDDAVRTNKFITDWITEFAQRCVMALETTGDDARNVKKHDEAIVAYSTALSLSDSTAKTLLIKWASTMLIHHSVNETLDGAAKFKLPKFVIFRAICDVLEADGRVTEAIACFRQMESEPAGAMNVRHDREKWEPGFKRRCTERLQKLGDVAMGSRNYIGATQHFSTVLSLNPLDPVDILLKRSKARAFMKLWEEALSDANEIIKLDASCHRGYEMKHAALHGARHHEEAVKAFDMMLSKIEQSPDPAIRQLRRQYVDARPIIRQAVVCTIRHMPRVLVDTTTGHLYDKKQQSDAFEALPIYHELISSMTTQLDHPRILTAVKEFYRYVMLSHRWEDGEPLFRDIGTSSIYNLKASPANIKLQRFCLLGRSSGFRWAWSDSSCVDQSSTRVLEESLVAMFAWYRGSSLTIVYLRDVSSESLFPSDLQGSIWNTRAWTYQEYVAAEIIRFYTTDWEPYRGLTLLNHKESPIVISEMQRATGVSAQEMAVLCPGLDRVREKLFLASRRESTLVEDIAYSLFGIFKVSISVRYGEGNQAVGRLLEHILAGSGDVSVLAWTGSAGEYNSCLPTDLSVYAKLVPPHIPLPIEKAEMDRIVTELRASLSDVSTVMRLYHRLHELPSPLFVASRLRIPGIVFPLPELTHVEDSDPETGLHVYRATTLEFGDVEIKTTDELTGMKGLCLVHPWIRTLLDQEHSQGVAMLDNEIQALRFVARLRQPFGALLFAPLSRVEYRRVATDGLIMVQIRDEVSVNQLMDSIRTIEVQ